MHSLPVSSIPGLRVLQMEALLGDGGGDASTRLRSLIMKIATRWRYSVGLFFNDMTCAIRKVGVGRREIEVRCVKDNPYLQYV